jgi:hypothetical protein
MKELLVRKLHAYIIENNPDLVLALSGEKEKEDYVRCAVAEVDILIEGLIEKERPPYIIEDICFDQLTKPLRPSKYAHVKAIAEEKFPKQYAVLERAGILVMEISNIVAICLPIFEVFNFSEATEDDDYLRESITLAIKGYFNG